MKRYFSIFLAFMAILGAGCGSEVSDISNRLWYVMSVSIPLNSTDARSCMANADAFATACNDGEFLKPHTTPATITLTREDKAIDPGPLTLEKYSITYSPMSPGAPVIEPMTVYHTQVLKEGENTLTNIIVVDVQRKQNFANLFLTGQQPMSKLPVGYNVTYKFYGRNAYGVEWAYDVFVPVYIGNYNECAACTANQA